MVRLSVSHKALTAGLVFLLLPLYQCAKYFHFSVITCSYPIIKSFPSSPFSAHVLIILKSPCVGLIRNFPFQFSWLSLFCSSFNYISISLSIWYWCHAQAPLTIHKLDLWNLRRICEAFLLLGEKRWKEENEEERASYSETAGLEAMSFSLASQWVSEWVWSVEWQNRRSRAGPHQLLGWFGGSHWLLLCIVSEVSNRGSTVSLCVGHLTAC